MVLKIYIAKRYFRVFNTSSMKKAYLYQKQFSEWSYFKTIFVNKLFFSLQKINSRNAFYVDKEYIKVETPVLEHFNKNNVVFGSTHLADVFII